MSTYRLHTVRSVAGDIILLKFIESMNFVKPDEDKIIDKLGGDIVFCVCTTSGATHQISTIDNTRDNTTKETVNKLALSIYDKWIHIHS
jgi:hypothetical protein